MDARSFEEDVIDRLARIETHVGALSDHEPRIRSLERRQSALAGATGLLTAVGAAVAAYLPFHK